MKTSTALFAASILLSTTANANLVVSADGQTIYDTDLNVTWLTNANLAASNTFGLATNTDLGVDANGYSSFIYSTANVANGSMTWGGAQKWIAAMNAANYLGYNDWRLPTTTDTGTLGCNYSFSGTDCGWNSAGSEMAHLNYNELGNLSLFLPPYGNVYPGVVGDYQINGGLTNTGPFINLQTSYLYMSTELSTDSWWGFGMGSGVQAPMGKISTGFALVVRPGQVAAVPVPAAAWLLGTGLLGLISVARRKAA